MIDTRIIIPLLRAGLYGVPVDLGFVPSPQEWHQALVLASRQGVAALVGEGLEMLPEEQRPPQEQMMRWVLRIMKLRRSNAVQRERVAELERLWAEAGIGCKEIKGNEIGKYYRNPDARYSCDYDCVLSDFEAGNKVVEAQGIVVDRGFYKNSSFRWHDLYVENHQFCTPVRGNREMKRLERLLRELLADEAPEAQANFNALFLVEHSWSHFFENALTLKQLCDWAVFRKACGSLVDWAMFEAEARACGFWEFAMSFDRIADLLDGVISPDALTPDDRRLLEDILSERRDVSMNEGWKTRRRLLLGYFTQGWKYRLFSNHSAMYCMLRTVAGFIFDRNP